VDVIQLGACTLGQADGGGRGKLGVLRTVGGQKDLGRKMLTSSLVLA
jgi:hypothetical protein